MTELRKLIERASDLVDTAFEPSGQMLAHILAIGRDSKITLIACPMGDAREEIAFRVGVPETLRTIGFHRWCFFSEAWTAEYGGHVTPETQLPADRADRIEVVAFAAEEGATGEQLRATRQIWRATPQSSGKLMPLVFPKLASRFVTAEQRQRAQERHI